MRGELSEWQPRPRHLAIGVVLALIVGVALVTGVGRMAGFAEIRRAFDGADMRWLAVCAIGQIVVFAGYTAALRHTMRRTADRRSLRRYSSASCSPALRRRRSSPFGGVAGLALVYWVLRRVGLDEDDAAVRHWVEHCRVSCSACSAGRQPCGRPSLARHRRDDRLVGDRHPRPARPARWFTAPSRVEPMDLAIDRWRPPARSPSASALPPGPPSLGTSEGQRLLIEAAMLLDQQPRQPLGCAQGLWRRASLRPLVAACTTGYLVQSLPIPLIATGGVGATTFLLPPGRCAARARPWSAS